MLHCDCRFQVTFMYTNAWEPLHYIMFQRENIQENILLFRTETESLSWGIGG